MSLRSPAIHITILLLTGTIALFSLWQPHMAKSLELPVLIFLVLLLGIPHGATDHMIFQHLSPSDLSLADNIRFYAGYLLIVALYGLLWYLAALFAFIIFLLISMYHFGQSNLQYVHFPAGTAIRVTAYLLWGGFVLLTPIVLHYQEAAPIIHSIIGDDPVSVAAVMANRYSFGFSLFFANLLLLTWLGWREYLDKADLVKEVINLVVLGLLFSVSPLLLAFAVYFTIWHSLASVLDQIEELRKAETKMGLGYFYLKALPITLISIVGMVFIYWLSQEMHLGISMVGLFFIIISTITLPHMLMVDRLYKSVG